MDATGGLSPIAGNPIVGDRGQRRRDPQAFRRALQDESNDTSEQAGETPVPAALQKPAPPGRRDQGARHIDVFA